MHSLQLLVYNHICYIQLWFLVSTDFQQQKTMYLVSTKKSHIHTLHKPSQCKCTCYASSHNTDNHGMTTVNSKHGLRSNQQFIKIGWCQPSNVILETKLSPQAWNDFDHSEYIKPLSKTKQTVPRKSQRIFFYGNIFF